MAGGRCCGTKDPVSLFMTQGVYDEKRSEGRGVFAFDLSLSFSFLVFRLSYFIAFFGSCFFFFLFLRSVASTIVVLVGHLGARVY